MNVGIVGGSVAGLSTAISILELSPTSNVTVYEVKKQFGEPCGGAIGIYMYNMLDKTFKKIIDEATLSPILDVEVYAPNGSCWKIQRSTPMGFLMDRTVLEQKMADKVHELGGKVLLDTTVYVMSFYGVSVDNGKWVDHDVVVDASGLKPPFPSLDDIHHCIQIEMPTPYIRKGSVKLYFGNNVAPKGYAWIFTVEDGLSKIGLGIPLSLKINPVKLLRKFIKSQPDLDYQLYERIEKKSLQSKIIPTAKTSKDKLYNITYHVGDRAFLCDPATGGGIANAILSARACAEAIVQHSPKLYLQKAKTLIKTNNMRYKIKHGLLYKMDDDGYNMLVDAIKGFTPKLNNFTFDIIKGILYAIFNNPKLLKYVIR